MFSDARLRAARLARRRVTQASVFCYAERGRRDDLPDERPDFARRMNCTVLGYPVQLAAVIACAVAQLIDAT